MQIEKDTTLLRLISILLRVSESQRRLTAAQLAEELNLPKPTVYRLVNQLNEVGLLKRDPYSKGQVPGDKLQQLSKQVLLHEVTNAPRRAILQELSDEVGETCNITFLDGKDLIYFDRVETDWPIRVQLPLGSRVPMHCTASGKLFLANMDKRIQLKLIQSLKLERHTDKTITDVTKLIEEVNAVEKSGIGTDEEEFIKGMVAIAVPILDKSSKMNFTLAVHAPTVRKSIDELHQYVPVLRKSAAAINALYEDQ